MTRIKRLTVFLISFLVIFTLYEPVFLSGNNRYACAEKNTKEYTVLAAYDEKIHILRIIWGLQKKVI